MKTQKVKAVAIGLIALAGCTGVIRAQQPAVTISQSGAAYQTADGKFYGWMFRPSQDFVVTDLGLYDVGGDGLIGTWHVCMWKYVANGSGGFDVVPIVSATIGPITGAPADGSCHYVSVQPTLVKYVGEGTYERNYFVGFWFAGAVGEQREPLWLGSSSSMVLAPALPVDHDAAYPVSALGNVPSSGPWGRPGGPDDPSWRYAVNFKWTLPGAPTANAGPDVQIYTSELALTSLAGSGMDPIPGPSELTYQWLKGSDVLKDSTPIGEGGAASLALASLASALPIGEHTLTLQVTDGETTGSDTMTLKIYNSPPQSQPSTVQAVEIGVGTIGLQGTVWDFEGDEVAYQWVVNGVSIGSPKSLVPQSAGSPTELLSIPPDDPAYSHFVLGDNAVQLWVSDGKDHGEDYTPVFAPVNVRLQDTIPPTVSAKTDPSILWPPNGEMRPITISVTTGDNSGGTIDFAVSVTSSEDDGSGDPDWTEPVVDTLTGVISLNLRAERLGTGDGRVYTITVVATDGSGNHSSVAVQIRVPHDKRKK
jgi:hypothetical protein